jgi:hypothetical protein
MGKGTLEAMRDFALACDDTKTAADFVASLVPGEASDLIRAAVTSDHLPQRIGRIAAELLRRDSEVFEQDVMAIVLQYPEDKRRAAFLSGLVEGQHQTQEPLDLGVLGPRVFVQPASIGIRDMDCLLKSLWSGIRHWALNRHGARW